jgi:hypothetical protein
VHPGGPAWADLPHLPSCLLPGSPVSLVDTAPGWMGTEWAKKTTGASLAEIWGDHPCAGTTE